MPGRVRTCRKPIEGAPNVCNLLSQDDQRRYRSNAFITLSRYTKHFLEVDTSGPLDPDSHFVKVLDTARSLLCPGEFTAGLPEPTTPLSPEEMNNVRSTLRVISSIMAENARPGFFRDPWLGQLALWANEQDSAFSTA